MSARAAGRTPECGDREARIRLADARAQLQYAEIANGASPLEEKKAAVSSSVLAGIAASDAACCATLGKVNRSQDHRDAVQLVRQIATGGTEAAKDLRRLLALKDESQYGFHEVGGQKLQQAVRLAKRLVTFAERAVEQ